MLIRLTAPDGEPIDFLSSQVLYFRPYMRAGHSVGTAVHVKHNLEGNRGPQFYHVKEDQQGVRDAYNRAMAEERVRKANAIAPGEPEYRVRGDC